MLTHEKSYISTRFYWELGKTSYLIVHIRKNDYVPPGCEDNDFWYVAIITVQEFREPRVYALNWESPLKVLNRNHLPRDQQREIKSYSLTYLMKEAEYVAYKTFIEPELSNDQHTGGVHGEDQS